MKAAIKALEFELKVKQRMIDHFNTEWDKMDTSQANKSKDQILAELKHAADELRTAITVLSVLLPNTAKQ